MQNSNLIKLTLTIQLILVSELGYFTLDLLQDFLHDVVFVVAEKHGVGSDFGLSGQVVDLLDSHSKDGAAS